ncbi:MAG: hypothetical protein ACKOU7_12450 [Ferruginibacter sp.]
MQINFKYLLVIAIAVFLTFELHELTHFFTGEWLGNKMAMTLNSGYPENGFYLKDWHYVVVSAAGPLFTIVQGLIFYFLLKKYDNYFLYPWLLTPFFMRLTAMILSFSNPNDEARISTYLGWGKFTLPLIVSVFLFFLVFTINQKYRYTKRFNLISLLLILFFYSAIILTDKFFHIRLL